jgi:nitrate/nitrite-specific signal transduction histidine kinase
MRTRSILTPTLAALALGAAACTEAEQDDAQADANEAGASLREEAAQVGSAIEAGAEEVAQEIDEGTDRLAQEADEQEAETAADARGN